MDKKPRYAINNSQKKRIIEAISSYLTSQKKEISIAYLFGSFITEDHFSDIDLGILIYKSLAKPLSFEISLENELEMIAGFSVDARILKGAPLSFCREVIQHGRVILDRDPNFRSDFEGLVLKKYFDFSRFHRRYLAEVFDAPL
jgi:predicted nucleotidyltransferase